MNELLMEMFEEENQREKEEESKNRTEKIV
jgi:hypothetical protein